MIFFCSRLLWHLLSDFVPDASKALEEAEKALEDKNHKRPTQPV